MAALSEAEIEQRRNASVKFGAERAVKQIQHGQALTGPAREAEEQVRDDLANIGRVEIVTNAAIRLEAVARLFYNAVIDASERGDMEKLDTYVKRFGWLQSSALRAWAQVKQEKADAPNALDYEIITSENKHSS